MPGSAAVNPAWEDARALRASVAPAAAAAAAWRELMSAMAFDEIDVTTQRAMPTIYRNLREQPGLPEQDRMRGAFKHAWSRSAELLRGARPVLAALGERGVGYRVVDGAAVQAISGGLGARALGGVDVLVADADLAEAQGAMATAGLHATGAPVCSRHGRAASRAPILFEAPALTVALHLAPAGHALTATILAAPGRAARLAETPLLVPPAELLVLRAAWRGRHADRVERLQGVVDAALLAPHVDPHRLVAGARRTGTLGALLWADSALRAAGAPTLGIDVPLDARVEAVAADGVRAGQRLAAPLTGAPGRIRSRRRGGEALAGVRAQFPGATRSYETWLRLGQLGATERVAVRARGGFLPPPEGTWLLGTSLSPFAGEAAPGLVASPVADLTLDWRFRVALPGPQSLLRVAVDSPVLDRQDSFVFRNGEPVGRVVAGDRATRSWEFHDVAAAQEFSLRPVWPACEHCYESLSDLRVTIGG